MIPHLELGGGNGAPLDVFGTLVRPLAEIYTLSLHDALPISVWVMSIE